MGKSRDDAPTESLMRRRAVPAAVSAILAMATSARAQDVAPGESAGREQLQEITVTAQRRTQSVQDIPYNISAYSGSALQSSGANSLSNLASLVPGLDSVDAGPAQRGNTNTLALRGLRTDSPVSANQPLQTVSPVSTYFGEVPAFFDIPLVDVERVEVLRGPQGTLYGSGAEGGTIRFIPNAPNPHAFAANVSMRGSYTERAHSPNWGVNGMINVPLSDTLAWRTVAGEEYLEGFITDTNLAVRADNAPQVPAPVPRIPGDPTSGFLIAPPLRDANNSRQWFARTALRWTPSAEASVELGYLHQRTQTDDAQQANPIWPGGTYDLAVAQVPPFPNSSYYSPSGGTYRNTSLIQEPFHSAVDLASLVGTYDFGFATLTAASSGFENRSFGIDDFTFGYYAPSNGLNFVQFYNNYPRFIAYEPTANTERAIIEEVRLVSNGERRVDYVAGAFFQRQRDIVHIYNPIPGLQQYDEQTGFPPTNPDGITSDSVYNINRTQDFTDRAIFGEVTWHITRAWQITGGLRAFWQKFNVRFQQTDPFCGSLCGDGPLGSTNVTSANSVSKHISKLNTSYDLNASTKVYFTYAEGFRRGGANGIPLVGNFASLPRFLTYAPDIAKNFELGLKGTLRDNKVRYSADIFWINLDNFQFNSYTPSGEQAVFNGSLARSKGAELEIEAQLSAALSAQLAYSHTQATVIDPVAVYDLPAYSGGGPGVQPELNFALTPGEHLPAISPDTVSLGLTHRLPITASSAGWTLVSHANFSYRSGSPASLPNALQPASWRLNPVRTLNVSLTLDSGKKWSAELFGTNLTSDPGVSGGTGVQGVPNPLAFRNVVRPRTLGLELHYSFE